MTLREDARGLHLEATLNPNDPDVQRLRTKPQRGDVNEMSMEFHGAESEWNDDYDQRRIRVSQFIAVMFLSPRAALTVRSRSVCAEVQTGRVGGSIGIGRGRMRPVYARAANEPSPIPHRGATTPPAFGKRGRHLDHRSLGANAGRIDCASPS
jgi:hypothetical protein